MSLLAPWNAVAAFAIAAPLLLLLYFLKLRRKRLRVSSTMLWERAVDDLQVNEPFRWLRSSWLLVLQMLALACLALAIGRPTIPGGGLLDDRVLLMIDTSASMRAGDASSGGTRFDEAQRRALELVDGLSRDAAVQVMAFAAEPSLLTGMSPDRNAAKAAIRSLEPTDEPGDLAEAVRLANALIATGAEGESVTTRAVVITDGGSAASTDPLAGDPLLERVGPGADAVLDNIGIVAAHLRRDYTDPTRVALFLRLQSALPREVSVPLSLELDGTPAERLAVTVPGVQAGQPGSRSVTVELTPGDASRLRVTLGREDALPTDNAAHFVLPEPARPDVLLVSPGDAVAWVVSDVIDALPGLSVRAVGAAGLEELLAGGSIADYDLAVLDRVGDPSRVPVPTLSFGLPLADTPIETDESMTSDRFVTWDRARPAVRDLALDGVSIASPAWFGGDVPAANVLARGRRGPVIVESADDRVRRVAVAFEPAESTWPIEISFPLFVAQAMETIARSPEGRQGWIRAGRAVRLLLPRGGGTTLQGPEPIEGRAIEAPPAGDEQLVAFPGARRVGLYSAADGTPVVGVNLLDASESAIGVSERLVLGGRAVVRAEEGLGRREIWTWLVVIAAAILMVEWVVFAIRSRV